MGEFLKTGVKVLKSFKRFHQFVLGLFGFIIENQKERKK